MAHDRSGEKSIQKRTRAQQTKYACPGERQRQKTPRRHKQGLKEQRCRVREREHIRLFDLLGCPQSQNIGAHITKTVQQSVPYMKYRHILPLVRTELTSVKTPAREDSLFYHTLLGLRVHCLLCQRKSAARNSGGIILIFFNCPVDTLQCMCAGAQVHPRSQMTKVARYLRTIMLPAKSAHVRDETWYSRGEKRPLRIFYSGVLLAVFPPKLLFVQETRP